MGRRRKPSREQSRRNVAAMIQRISMKRSFVLALLAISGFFVACHAAPVATTPAGAASAPSSSASAAFAGPTVSVVNTSVVFKDCPDAATLSPKAAEAAVKRFVDSCRKVPTGAAHFQVTLLPGGRVEFASPEGDTEGGLVPTCVVNRQPSHRLALQKACKLDVQLDEHSQ